MVTDKRIAPRDDEWTHLCDDDGDGTGNSLAVGDFLATPTTFFFTCPPGFRVGITRMFVFIRDSGAFTAERYGSLPELGVGQGILVRVRDAADDIRIDKLDGLEVRSNADWGRHCHDTRETAFGGGDNFVSARWSFFKDHKNGIFLTAGEKFEVHCRADLSGLIDHRFLLRGDIFVQ